MDPSGEPFERTGMRYFLCAHIKRWLFINCRYPAFSPEFIRVHIERPETRPRELQAYMSSSTLAGRRQALLLIAIYLIYCLKNLFIVYETTANLFDYDDLAGNIKWHHHEHPPSAVKQIACMKTNCSLLAPPDGTQSLSLNLVQLERRRYWSVSQHQLATLADEFSRLPLFLICHPHLDKIYTPIEKLDSFGILAFACSSFNVLLLGSWITIQQFIWPAQSEMLLFVPAPEVTLELMRRRARELLDDVAQSLRNFRLCLQVQLARDNEELQLASSWRPRGGLANRLYASSSAPTFNETQAPRIEVATLEEANECLPITRCEWWRAGLARIFLNVFGGAALGIGLIGLIAFTYIQHRINRRVEQLGEYAEFVRRSGCRVWLADDQQAENNPLDIGKLDLTWTYYAILETGMMNLMPGFSISMMLAHYVTMINEVNLYLDEVRFHLMASLVVARYKMSRYSLTSAGNQWPNATSPRRDHSELDGGQYLRVRTHHFYNMQFLRQGFRQETLVFGISFFRRRRSARSTLTTRHDDQIHSLLDSIANGRECQLLERILVEQRHHRQESEPECEDELELDVKTMEQIYVNFRLFVEYVQNLGPSVTVAVVVCYVLNYGIVIISLLCSRNLTNLNMEPTVLIVSGWTIANCFIFLTAKFHSNAKKLQPILWSIIAELSDSRDPRLQHLHHLWIKQVLALGENGFALSAIGYQVKLVNLMQMAIGTGTISLLAIH